MTVGLLIPPLVLSTPPVPGAHNSRWQRETARHNGQSHSLFILMKDPLHPFSFTLTTIRFAHFGLWLGLWSFSYRTLSLHLVCSSTVSVKSSQGHRVTTELLKQKANGARAKRKTKGKYSQSAWKSIPCTGRTPQHSNHSHQGFYIMN